MQIKRPILCMLALAALTLFFLVDVSEAFARGPGGGGPGGGRGGGFGRGGRGGPGGARGRAGLGRARGRTHHHRRGPASRGNFYSRSRSRAGMRRPPRSSSYRRPDDQPRPQRPTTQPPTRPSQPLPPSEPPSQEQLENRAELREKRDQRREKQREDRREEWRRRRHREALGTTYSYDYWDDDAYDYWDDDYCEAEVVVDGVTYFQCDGVWYRRAYSGGTVDYVVVEGPRAD
ncbi:MAG: hypothetical protein QNJ01_12145 [Desulfobacterales bacterium]|nr:hypothetical protein [Desulfobacterales bacterium]